MGFGGDLQIDHGLFSRQVGVEDLFVSLSVGVILNFSEFFFSGVVIDEFEVALSVQNEFLPLGLLV